MAEKQTENHKPTLLIQVLCVVALVVLSLIDAAFDNFAVSNIVYAIIAGLLFGVGSIKQFLGGGKG